MATLANLDPVDSPLKVSPDDLAEVVQALARQKDGRIRDAGRSADDRRVSYEQKNALNNMTAKYAEAQRRMYLKETKQIHAFPGRAQKIYDPSAFMNRWLTSSSSRSSPNVRTTRPSTRSWNICWICCSPVIPILQHAHKRLTRALLFYMYWNCDIGEDGDVETDQALAS